METGIIGKIIKASDDGVKIGDLIKYTIKNDSIEYSLVDENNIIYCTEPILSDLIGDNTWEQL